MIVEHPNSNYILVISNIHLASPSMTNTVSRGEDVSTQLTTPPYLLSEWMQSSINKPQDSVIKVSKEEYSVAWKLVSFWQEQGLNFIALITSLLLTRILGIKGWLAIPFCLITIGATIKAIDCKESREQGHPGGEKRNLSQQKPLVKQQKISPIITSSVVGKNKDSLQPRKVTYRFVHKIPGRVRIHVPLINQDAIYAQRLEKLLKTDIQATSVRMNRDAASIIVNYKAGVIPDSQWHSHLVSLIQSARNAAVTTKSKAVSIIMTCSLEVRQATVSSQSCCLLKSKSGKSLKGGAVAARSHRLHRMGVLV